MSGDIVTKSDFMTDNVTGQNGLLIGQTILSSGDIVTKSDFRTDNVTRTKWSTYRSDYPNEWRHCY